MEARIIQWPQPLPPTDGTKMIRARAFDQGNWIPLPKATVILLIQHWLDSGQEVPESIAIADLQLAEDANDLKPVRYYAMRWGWEATRVHRLKKKLATSMQQECNKSATRVQQECNKKRPSYAENGTSCNKSATRVQQECNKSATVLTEYIDITNTSPPPPPLSRGGETDEKKIGSAVEVEPTASPALPQGGGELPKGKKKGGGRIAREHFANAARAIPIPAGLDTERFRSVWAEWIEYRYDRSRPKQIELAFGKMLAFLSRFSVDEAVECINQSLRNSWQGLFPPKKDSVAKTQPPRGFDPTKLLTKEQVEAEHHGDTLAHQRYNIYQHTATGKRYYLRPADTPPYMPKEFLILKPAVVT